MSNNEYKILIVDDEPDILEFVGYNLEKEGYAVKTASSGKEALERAAKHQPHLILLDVMMPGMDGIETCDQLRKMPALKETMIAFLTARGEDYSQVAGFDAGADDYITKPIKPKVLISRIKALLRRQGGQQDVVPKKLEFGDLVIDTDQYLIKYKGKKIDLPRKEFELLSLLVSRPGKVFPREEIMDKIWGNDVIVGGRTIDVHIRKLREKIGNDKIKTIKGVGYKFED
jgi:two-component system alkaline phosphatase synthesis response regulator PhoP